MEYQLCAWAGAQGADCRYPKASEAGWEAQWSVVMGHQNPCLYPVRSGWVPHNGCRLVQEELLLAASSVSRMLFIQGSEAQGPSRFRGLTLPRDPTCPFLPRKEGKRNHF